jgi:hypothetical protein
VGQTRWKVGFRKVGTVMKVKTGEEGCTHTYVDVDGVGSGSYGRCRVAVLCQLDVPTYRTCLHPPYKAPDPTMLPASATLM